MNRKIKANRFKIRLFWAFTLLFTVIAFIISALFFHSSYDNARGNERQNSLIVLERISTQVESLYDQMDIAATSITKNPAMKEIILDLNASGADHLLPADALQVKPKIQPLLTNMMFSPIISNVLLYDQANGYFYYTGIYHGDTSYIKEVLAGDTSAGLFRDPSVSRIFLGPHQTPWLREPKSVVSVIRNFSDNTTTSGTLIEIQVPYSYLDLLCRQDTFGTEKEILILDREGDIVYPSSKADL